MAQQFDDLIFNIRNVSLGAVVSSGAKTPWGFLRATYLDSIPVTPTPAIPNYALDPPVPPVWPVLGAGKFASDVIYGSERMNTNLRFVRGNTYVVECIAVLDGDVVDLTDKVLTLTVKKNLNDSTNFLQLTSPSGGITITDAINGNFTCTFASSLTASLPSYVQRFPYDIEMSEGSTVNSLSRGYLIIIPSVG